MSADNLEIIEINQLNCDNSDEDVKYNYEDIEIPRVSCENLSYDDFFENYMMKNLPIIITNISKNWECTNWIKNSSIDFEYLKNKISNVKVPISNCSEKYYNSHEKLEMNFHGYLIYWEELMEIEHDENTKLYYLKDWHLRKDFPDYKFYKTPKYFASDWLNEYLSDLNKDDYMFVYFGPQKTWTPFHADVLSSYSWSTNINGIKKWLILKPGEEIKLKDSLGNLPFNINEEILDKSNIKYFTVKQKTGEALFVPSGYFHQVWNLDDTISVNHNWLNGCNVFNVWKSLKSNLIQIDKEISDCRAISDFDQQCQVMLKSLFGMDFEDFMELLNYILKKRIDCLNNKTDIILFDEIKLGETHLLFDINAIKKVLDDFRKHEIVIKLGLDTKCLPL